MQPGVDAGLVDTVAAVLERDGVELSAWGLAWARVLPSVTLVPAFGLRALPQPARVTLALVLGLGIAPALTPLTKQARPWVVLLLEQIVLGLPVAVTAALALWIASMAGGLIDNLRGGKETAHLPVVDTPSTPTGTLLSLLTAIAFLEGGGPARVASALMRTDLQFTSALPRVVAALTSGIELALAVAAPVVAASIVVEVAGALIARAASPAYIQPMLAPLRSLVILGAAALLFDRMLELCVLLANRY